MATDNSTSTNFAESNSNVGKSKNEIKEASVDTTAEKSNSAENGIHGGELRERLKQIRRTGNNNLQEELQKILPTGGSGKSRSTSLASSRSAEYDSTLKVSNGFD